MFTRRGPNFTRIIIGWFAVVALLHSQAATSVRADAVTAKQAAVGTETRVGAIDGLEVRVKVQGPATQQTPLQTACLFEYLEGDIFNPPALPPSLNGIVHLDQALHGLITELRRSGKFAGHALETLLIVPATGAISAQRLLLVGLGDRKQFTPELMRRVGEVEMREALRLGVTSYSHASDLKDAGVDSPTAAVAQAVLAGNLAALSTQRFLSAKNEGPVPSIRSLTLLAGPAFFAETSLAAASLLATTNGSH